MMMMNCYRGKAAPSVTRFMLRAVGVPDRMISAHNIALKRSLSSATRQTTENLIVVEQDQVEGVYVIRLNRPDKLNALNEQLGDELVEAVESLSAKRSSDLRSVVLTGNGKAFSAGGDLGFLMDRTQTTAEANTTIMHQFYNRFLSLRKLPVPVIAAINGHAIGAGLCLALSCDMRVCAQDAKLGVNFVKIGIHPGTTTSPASTKGDHHRDIIQWPESWAQNEVSEHNDRQLTPWSGTIGMAATHFLPRLIGPQIASQLILTGEPVSGSDAARLGLVLEALPTDQVVARALALARTIAAASPIAVRLTTRTLRAQLNEGLSAALHREADAQAHSYASEDMLEGLRAIREKCQPSFKGH